MTKEECIALLNRYAEYNGMGIPNLAGCREAMRMAADLLSQPSLPTNLDEAANNYGVDIRLGYPRVMDETDKYIYNAFKAGAEWMAEQGVSMQITDDTEWEEVDSFVHKNVDGCSIIQIRKK